LLLKGFQEVFYKNLLAGDGYPYDYAVLKDNEASLNKETIYGSRFQKNSANTSKEQAIENRKRIGMSPYYDGPGIFPGFTSGGFHP
jgi:hypothetical protein